MATLRKERLYQGSLTVSEVWSIVIMAESIEVCMALEQQLRGTPWSTGRETDILTDRKTKRDTYTGPELGF